MPAFELAIVLFILLLPLWALADSYGKSVTEDARRNLGVYDQERDS